MISSLKISFLVTILSLTVVTCSKRHSDQANLMTFDARKAVGRGASYRPVELDADKISADMALRRSHAWAVFRQLNEPYSVPGTTVTVSMWQTWYDQDEFSALFKKLWDELTPQERQAKAPFQDSKIEAALDQ